ARHHASGDTIANQTANPRQFLEHIATLDTGTASRTVADREAVRLIVRDQNRWSTTLRRSKGSGVLAKRLAFQSVVQVDGQPDKTSIVDGERNANRDRFGCDSHHRVCAIIRKRNLR